MEKALQIIHVHSILQGDMLQGALNGTGVVVKVPFPNALSFKRQ